MDAPHHFIIADDHPLFRGALRQTLEKSFESVRIVEAGSLSDVTEILEAGEDIDLILLDLSMPGMRGFSGLMYLRAQFPSVPAVIVSATEDTSSIRRCLEFGAAGFIPKSLGPEIIESALEAILAGNIWVPADINLDSGEDAESDLVARLSSLTPQQVRVLMMLSQGLLNKQIAYELTVSEATVKAHVSAILQKMGVDSRTQAVIAAAKIEAGQLQSIGKPTE